ncbi:ribonuclease P protein component [Candidatus Wolfebacteria bacterium RBG_13_41_7]|uniref:Ribonuclease P protein component n=1 Tax=Candidatus Wolfebacteria bacterium RBG_13_41_7 TaxID=1802554 RepID=A0A1F8DQY8_9BACT|nr:MAG: ribonuclease P protein component [Candidatus Wolfebacteria bacterium RBG_13_41_7]
MLQKVFRLPIHEWMEDKKSKTIAVNGNFFIARKRENRKNFSRFGILVNTKVFKGAVERNRIKRKVFEVIRVLELCQVPGKDILISVLPIAANLPEKKVIESLLLILKKI